MGCGVARAPARACGMEVAMSYGDEIDRVVYAWQDIDVLRLAAGRKVNIHLCSPEWVESPGEGLLDAKTKRQYCLFEATRCVVGVIRKS